MGGLRWLLVFLIGGSVTLVLVVTNVLEAFMAGNVAFADAIGVLLLVAVAALVIAAIQKAIP